MAQSGHDLSGGEGYSGGGGWGQSSGGIGGSNGNDGGQGSGSYGGAGGTGSWEDITAYELAEFTLSPGQGGQSDIGIYGGGGGGVLVGGQGPSRSQCQGEGYGGGGCRDSTDGSVPPLPGLPGVILVEVV